LSRQAADELPSTTFAIKECSMSESAGKPRLNPEVSVYHAYIVGRHGLSIRAIEIDCADDEAAIESAKQLVDSHDVELWQMDRPVARFDVASHEIVRR
jgi:hypothetical protein